VGQGRSSEGGDIREERVVEGHGRTERRNDLLNVVDPKPGQGS